MKLCNMVRDEEGYLIDRETGERVAFYECDPCKNFLCDRKMCRARAGEENEGAVGFCASTPEPRFRKEGGRAFHKRWNGVYFGREYIEGADGHDD